MNKRNEAADNIDITITLPRKWHDALLETDAVKQHTLERAIVRRLVELIPDPKRKRLSGSYSNQPMPDGSSRKVPDLYPPNPAARKTVAPGSHSPAKRPGPKPGTVVTGTAEDAIREARAIRDRGVVDHTQDVI